MRAAHEAQVMPPISSSTGVFMAGGRGRPAASATGHLVTRFLHGGADGGLVDRRLAGDGQAAAGEVDVDGGDAGDLRDLLGHGVDAVAAGHADDGVGGAAHGVLSRKWDNGRERRSGTEVGSGSSGTDEAGDGLGGLADLLVGLGASGPRRLDDAVAEVLLEQPQRDGLQCLGHRRDLGEDVDAVLLVLDHPLQAAGLALDAAQPLEVLVLAVDVAVLMVGRLREVGALLDGLHVVPLCRRRGPAAREELYPPRVYASDPGSVSAEHSRSTVERSRSAVERSCSASSRADASWSWRSTIVSAEAREWPSSSSPRNRAASPSWWREYRRWPPGERCGCRTPEVSRLRRNAAWTPSRSAAWLMVSAG